MTDLRQTQEFANYLSLEGWIVVRNKGVNYFIKKLPVIGGILKIQRPKFLDIKQIDILCRKYGIFQIVVEPIDDIFTSDLKKNGYKLAKSTYLPSKTLQIDLTKSQKEIFKDLQRNIRTGVARGEVLTVKQYSSVNEIEKFRDVWKNSVNSKRFVPSLKSLLNLRKSFPGKKSLFLASHNIFGRIIGGVIFTITLHEGSNYIISYMYGFSSEEGRSSLSMASLLYQGILWGKKIGCKIFDFEGLYDPRFPNKDWLGFTRFKKSFGGYEVLYPGCYTKLRIPFK